MGKKQQRHGGYREGAGRPRKFSQPKTFGIVMESTDVERIERVAEAAGKTPTEWAREKLIAAVRRAER